MAEAAPTFRGHQMARELAEAGIQTTAITDSAIYAMMARVNKVRAGFLPFLIGWHAVEGFPLPPPLNFLS